MKNLAGPDNEEQPSAVKSGMCNNPQDHAGAGEVSMRDLHLHAAERIPSLIRSQTSHVCLWLYVRKIYKLVSLSNDSVSDDMRTIGGMLEEKG